MHSASSLIRYSIYCTSAPERVIYVANQAKLLIIDPALAIRRTVSIKVINDQTMQLVSAVGSNVEAMEKIKFFKPDVIVLGIENVDARNLSVFEGFVKDIGLPLVIITNESAALLHLSQIVKIEFVARPPLTDMTLVEQAAEGVLQKAKRIKNIPAPSKVSVPLQAKNLLRETVAAPAQAAVSQKPVFGERSVYQIQGKSIERQPLTHSRYGGHVIAIGSSTGGTEALYAVLTKLPQDMPPILIVQHIPPVFSRLYAERLNLNCKFEVREAQNGDMIYPGLALIAPGDKQMCLTRRGGKLAVECVRTEKVGGHCPSVDALFETVAATMGRNALGIILTGMGKDGARGMVEMHKMGAYTLGQDEESSVVYGMPKAAYEMGGVDEQSNLDRMPDLILKVLREKVK